MLTKGPIMSQDTTSIRQLVTEVAKDAKHLLDTQTELAKVETKQTREQATATGGLFAAAAVTGALGGIFLLVTIAWILVELGLPTWAGFGIVTLVLFLTAAVTGLMGKKNAGSIQPLVLTKLELDRTKKALSGAGTGTGTAVAVPASTLPKPRS